MSCRVANKRRKENSLRVERDPLSREKTGRSRVASANVDLRQGARHRSPVDHRISSVKPGANYPGLFRCIRPTFFVSVDETCVPRAWTLARDGPVLTLNFHSPLRSVAQSLHLAKTSRVDAPPHVATHTRVNNAAARMCFAMIKRRIDKLTLEKLMSSFAFADESLC